MAGVLNYTDVKDWDVATIDAKVSELRKEMFTIRMQKAAAGINISHRPSDIRRSIARLLTARRHRSLESKRA